MGENRIVKRPVLSAGHPVFFKVSDYSFVGFLAYLFYQKARVLFIFHSLPEN